MVRKVINLGQLPSGIGGDTSRSANVKCNENFAELYDTLSQVAEKSANSSITSLSGLTTALSIEQGGTGAKTGVDACRNIGALALNAHNHSYGTLLQNEAQASIEYIDPGNRERGPLTLANAGNKHACCVLTFHRIGDFACFFGLDTDNQLKVGGWSMGKAYRIYHEGNTFKTSDGTIKAV